MLYRDVGWDYGPLPVYVLALLFQVSKTIVWAKLLDLVLAGASVWSVFVIARRLVARRTAVWLAAWAALLGASKGLLSFHLEAYTSAVAWGAATSLSTLAAASGWVAGRSAASLAAAAALAVASVLSKPEYGLAGASVLAFAVLERRPSKVFAITAVATSMNDTLSETNLSKSFPGKGIMKYEKTSHFPVSLSISCSSLYV